MIRLLSRTRASFIRGNGGTVKRAFSDGGFAKAGNFLLKVIAGGYLGLVQYEFYSIGHKLDKLDDISNEVSRISGALEMQGLLQSHPKKP